MRISDWSSDVCSSDLESKDPLLIFPGFKIGKDGLEKTLDQRLIGKAGAARVEVSARGRQLRNLDTVPAKVGETIRLPVDAAFHAYAARQLGDHSGSDVIIHCATGPILSMVYITAYLPQDFNLHITLGLLPSPLV